MEKFIYKKDDPERYTVNLFYNKNLLYSITTTVTPMAEYWYEKWKHSYKEYNGKFKVILYNGTIDNLTENKIKEETIIGTSKYKIDIKG